MKNETENKTKMNKQQKKSNLRVAIILGVIALIISSFPLFYLPELFGVMK